MQKHLVLLGDSVFDNSTYVPDGPSVSEHLSDLLSAGGQATMLARDGAVVASVFSQIERIPDDATHLILSVGGNDALGAASALLSKACSDVRDGLVETYRVCQAFAQAYQQLYVRLLEYQLPLTSLTIYDGVPGLDDAERGGLCLFNDVITRTAFSHGANVIDLRLLCDAPADYSAVSPIEPSNIGGRKIAQALIRASGSTEENSRVVC